MYNYKGYVKILRRYCRMYDFIDVKFWPLRIYALINNVNLKFTQEDSCSKFNGLSDDIGLQLQLLLFWDLLVFELILKKRTCKPVNPY